MNDLDYDQNIIVTTTSTMIATILDRNHQG